MSAVQFFLSLSQSIPESPKNHPIVFPSHLSHISHSILAAEKPEKPEIVAYGFVGHPSAYIRDPWNWIDFLVVVWRSTSGNTKTGHKL
jgi:hypothetical protein